MVLCRLRGEINSYVLNYTDPDNCCSVSLFFCNSCHNVHLFYFQGFGDHTPKARQPFSVYLPATPYI